MDKKIGLISHWPKNWPLAKNWPRQKIGVATPKNWWMNQGCGRGSGEETDPKEVSAKRQWKNSQAKEEGKAPAVHFWAPSSFLFFRLLFNNIFFFFSSSLLLLLLSLFLFIFVCVFFLSLSFVLSGQFFFYLLFRSYVSVWDPVTWRHPFSFQY